MKKYILSALALTFCAGISISGPVFANEISVNSETNTDVSSDTENIDKTEEDETKGQTEEETEKDQDQQKPVELEEALAELSKIDEYLDSITHSDSTISSSTTPKNTEETNSDTMDIPETETSSDLILIQIETDPELETSENNISEPENNIVTVYDNTEIIKENTSEIESAITEIQPETTNNIDVQTETISNTDSETTFVTEYDEIETETETEIEIVNENKTTEDLEDIDIQTESETIQEEIITEDTTLQDTEYPMYYANDTTQITIVQAYVDDSVCYIAHITTTGENPFQTDYAWGEWGYYEDYGDGYLTGETCSHAAERLGCIFLVNGDFRDMTNGQWFGIIRNGEIINDLDSNYNTMGITDDGNLLDIQNLDTEWLQLIGVDDTFTFGPTLVLDGNITQEAYDADNTYYAPRTLIGQVYGENRYSDKEYYIVIVDGRNPGYSDGFNILQCAELMQELGCDYAYNLDGGGSSAMIFNGQLLNVPASTSVIGVERNDTDFLYIK